MTKIEETATGASPVEMSVHLPVLREAAGDYRLPCKAKREWLAALRDGTRTQGKHQLKSIRDAAGEQEYCCLGVLGETCGVPEKLLRGYSYLSSMIGSSDDHIPASLPHLPYVLERQLARLNDRDELSFTEIADLIEQGVADDCASSSGTAAASGVPDKS